MVLHWRIEFTAAGTTSIGPSLPGVPPSPSCSLVALSQFLSCRSAGPRGGGSDRSQRIGTFRRAYSRCSAGWVFRRICGQDFRELQVIVRPSASACARRRLTMTNPDAYRGWPMVADDPSEMPYRDLDIGKRIPSRNPRQLRLAYQS